MKNNVSTRLFSAATAVALLLSATGIASFASLASAAGPVVTTTPATSITSTDATLNGLEGDADATATAFWVSTSTFAATASASPTLPSGVYSTGGLPAVASSTAFSAPLSSTTIPAGLLPVTAGTTYFYVAWSFDGTTWTPGAVLSFTTVSAPTITSVTPSTGSTLGGTAITINGTGFATGATVTVGGTPAASVVVASSTAITAVTPPGTAGAQNVVVTNTDTGTASSTGGFTYVTPVVSATPVISNITVSPLASTTATVNWTTDIAANGQVMYGTTTGYGSSSALNATATTSHSVVLTGLSEGTTYHFQIQSSNGSSTATSSDQSFVTQSTASSTPLHVDSVTTVNSSATADNSFSDGWKWVMHVTVPDNENAFRIKFSDWAMSSTTSFPAGSNIRLSSPQSSNASTTDSGIVETGNGYSGWFYLTGDSAPLTPGRQIDLTIEVKVPVGTAAGSYTTTYTAQSYPQTATSTAI